MEKSWGASSAFCVGRVDGAVGKRPIGRPPEVEEQVLALLQERMSQRGISRALKI